MGTTIHEALQCQKTKAEAIRRQQDVEMPCEQNESKPEVQMLTQEAVEMLQSVPCNLAASGPIAFATHLVQAATLNQDQRAPVALVAKEMQIAWGREGKPQHMKPHGRILRMLLLGGGGCGKSHREVGLHSIVSPILGTSWPREGLCIKQSRQRYPR